MTALETQLQPVTDELDSLTARIKPLEAEIKALDQQHAAGIEIDRSRRNSLYNEYEPLFKRRRALFEANSSDFKVLDDLEKADKDMMEQWKALGGKVN
jgi:peptidoglycan hydrolase CwlO-like protein